MGGFKNWASKTGPQSVRSYDKGFYKRAPKLLEALVVANCMGNISLNQKP